MCVVNIVLIDNTDCSLINYENGVQFPWDPLMHCKQVLSVETKHGSKTQSWAPWGLPARLRTFSVGDPPASVPRLLVSYPGLQTHFQCS